MSTCYLVLDANGNPAVGVVIQANYDGKSPRVQTNADGIAKFIEDVPDYAVIVQPYNVSVTRTPCPVSFPPPQGTGPYGNAYDSTPGKCAPGYSENVHWDPSKRGAFVQCIWDPKPQPTADWAQGVEKSLAEFGQGLAKAVMTARNAVDALRQDFADFKASMYGWLVEHVLEALLASLDKGVRNRGSK